MPPKPPDVRSRCVPEKRGACPRKVARAGFRRRRGFRVGGYGGPSEEVERQTAAAPRQRLWRHFLGGDDPIPATRLIAPPKPPDVRISLRARETRRVPEKVARAGFRDCYEAADADVRFGGYGVTRFIDPSGLEFFVDTDDDKQEERFRRFIDVLKETDTPVEPIIRFLEPSARSVSSICWLFTPEQARGVSSPRRMVVR